MQNELLVKMEEGQRQALKLVSRKETRRGKGLNGRRGHSKDNEENLLYYILLGSAIMVLNALNRLTFQK